MSDSPEESLRTRLASRLPDHTHSPLDIQNGSGVEDTLSESMVGIL